jgi:hypothetical protein
MHTMTKSPNAPTRTYHNFKTATLSLLTAAGLVIGSSERAGASSDVVNMWYASRSALAKTNWLYGHDGCRREEGDCNACIPDVEEQFDGALAAGDMTWTLKPWNFAWGDSYAPSEITPNQAFDDGVSFHVQGFVRTNVDSYPTAAIHSDDTHGALAITVQDASGKKSLKALHRTMSTHPSGLSSIGNYVSFVDNDYMRFVNVTTPTASQSHYYKLPGPIQLNSDKNGGAGIAKLHGGGHLIAFVTGGQSEPSQRRTAFVHLDGNMTSPTRIQYLGDHLLTDAMKDWPSSVKTWDGAIFPENASLITECGSRNLYMVYMGGPTTSYDGTAVIHLARVEWNESGPRTRTVGMWTKSQTDEDCYFRGGASAGNAWNWEPRKLRILCHERSTRSRSYFNFTEGVYDGPITE